VAVSAEFTYWNDVMVHLEYLLLLNR